MVTGAKVSAFRWRVAGIRAVYRPARGPTSSAWVFTPGYASFLRTVPRAGVIRQGRVNPMQLAGLDGPLAELISPCTDPARLDASQDRRFRHADSFDQIEGVEEHAPIVPSIADVVEARDPVLAARHRLAVDDAGARA